MILDLTSKGYLNEEDSRLIDEIEEDTRSSYNKFIKELIHLNNLKSIDLLVDVTCRNPGMSSVLLNACRLGLIEKRLKKNIKFSSIKIDNKYLKKPIKKLLKNYNNTSCDILITDVSSNLIFVIIRNIIRSIYGSISNIFWSRYFNLKKIPSSSIIYVDTFLLSNSFDNEGNYHDRYFTGFEKFLTPNENVKIWFAPVIEASLSSQKDYKKFFLKISKSKTNFLIEESWLNLNDYFICFIHSLMIPFKIKNIPLLKNHDFSLLIQNELRHQIGSFSLMKTIGKYKFIKKLKNKQIVIDRAIDWHENQVVDRALNLGFKEFYPEVEVQGYQGFMTPEFYTNVQPQKYEKLLKTIPDVIHAIGPYAHAYRKGACKDLKVQKSPALRFSYLKDISLEPLSNIHIIFILPMVLEECRMLIKYALSLTNEPEYTQNIYIKLHPTYDLDYFKTLVADAADNRLNFVSEDIPSLLAKASVIISSSSSAIFEAYSLGIPVGIMANNSGVSLNPLPKDLDGSSLIYNEKELSKLIKTSVHQYKTRENQSNKILYLPNSDLVRKLFIG